MWNHRIIRQPAPDGGYMFSLVEMFYGENDAPWGWAFAEPAKLETVDEVAWMVERMRDAFTMSTVDVDESGRIIGTSSDG